MTDDQWLRFEVSGRAHALPLAAIGEVTQAREPRLIPFLPLEVAGIVNVRGEPLPTLDTGVILGAAPTRGHRHLLVMGSEPDRIGLLVGSVSRIARALRDAPKLEPDDDDQDRELVRFVRALDGPVGLVDPEVLLERGRRLLGEPHVKLQGGHLPCQHAF